MVVRNYDFLAEVASISMVLPDHGLSLPRGNDNNSRATVAAGTARRAAAGAPPLTYRDLMVNPKPKRRRPTAPRGPRSQPGSLALPPAGRPWRQVASLE